ncbi:MAG TPA: hypothetical protein VMH83_13665 [Candidatus Acidoferrum sp.]|nr:hypothetical protein [Candidatus Acidoferrum sp.]
MSFFPLVLGFVLCISAMGMFFDYRKQQMKMMMKMNEMEQGAVQKELQDIKQRLVVLERIVTDKNYSLHEEFSSLKDK